MLQTGVYKTYVIITIANHGNSDDITYSYISMLHNNMIRGIHLCYAKESSCLFDSIWLNNKWKYIDVLIFIILEFIIQMYLYLVSMHKIWDTAVIK